MIIRKINNLDELKVCVELYIRLNDETFIPADKERSETRILEHLKEGAFLRVAVVDNQIRAWLLARKVQHDHTEEAALQQLYYGSDLSGIKAVRAITLLHDEMVQEAINKRIPRVISSGSHMDDSDVFTRVLERHGWLRRGYMATRVVLTPKSRQTVAKPLT